jgi:hypothetical protein
MFKKFLQSIGDGFLQFVKWITVIGLLAGLGWVIFKIISSKNPNKFDAIKNIFIKTKVSDEKKDKINENNKKVDTILSGIKDSIKESEDFLNQ